MAKDAREHLLNEAVAQFRGKGFTATRIDDICAAAGVSKGAFFHHFRSKEDVAQAAADRFAANAEAFFGPQTRSDRPPGERIAAYVAQRTQAMAGDLADVTCLLGMMAQETYRTHPEIGAACGRHIVEHARTLLPDIAAARSAAAATGDWTDESLALFIQATIQGAFILAKGLGDMAVARQCMTHLERYLATLFASPADQPR
jgi:TetR/AcrR family transcriptional repressor of nem operon